jgi:acyl-coenzyme A thioesterase PaaI-like protein
VKKLAEIASADEAELLASIRASFVERMPFNKILGIDVLSLHHDRPELRFDMRPELVGNYTRNILHGGVISSVLDVTGGLVAFLGVQQKSKGKPVAEVLERLWGGDETLIVVSSDLSHYLPYAEAGAKDRATVARILQLDPTLDHAQACGATPLSGALLAARAHGLVPRLLDLCNSGDTATSLNVMVSRSEEFTS